MDTKICRICGKFDDNYVYIFKVEGLQNKIETCLPIVISRHSLLPDTICNDCEENFNNFYLFIKNCVQNIIVLEAQYDIVESCLKTKRKKDKSCSVSEKDFYREAKPKKITNVDFLSDKKFVEISKLNPKLTKSSVIINSAPKNSFIPNFSSNLVDYDSSDASSDLDDFKNPKSKIPNLKNSETQPPCDISLKYSEKSSKNVQNMSQSFQNGPKVLENDIPNEVDSIGDLQTINTAHKSPLLSQKSSPKVSEVLQVAKNGVPKKIDALDDPQINSTPFQPPLPSKTRSLNDPKELQVAENVVPTEQDALEDLQINNSLIKSRLPSKTRFPNDPKVLQVPEKVVPKEVNVLEDLQINRTLIKSPLSSKTRFSNDPKVLQVPENVVPREADALEDLQIHRTLIKSPLPSKTRSPIDLKVLQTEQNGAPKEINFSRDLSSNLFTKKLPLEDPTMFRNDIKVHQSEQNQVLKTVNSFGNLRSINLNQKSCTKPQKNDPKVLQSAQSVSPNDAQDSVSRLIGTCESYYDKNETKVEDNDFLKEVDPFGKPGTERTLSNLNKMDERRFGNCLPMVENSKTDASESGRGSENPCSNFAGTSDNLNSAKSDLPEEKVGIKRKIDPLLPDLCKKVPRLESESSSRRKNKQPKRIIEYSLKTKEEIDDKFKEPSPNLVENGQNSNFTPEILQSCLLCEQQFCGQVRFATHMLDIHGIDLSQVFAVKQHSDSHISNSVNSKKKLPELVKISDVMPSRSKDVSHQDSYDGPEILDAGSEMGPSFSLEAVLPTHTLKNLHCDECPSKNHQIFSTFQDFSAHRRSQHNIFHCDLCLKYYGRNSHLWKHVNRVHKGNPAITCRLCQKTSASKYHLAQHFSKMHSLKKEKNYYEVDEAKMVEEEFINKKFDGFDFQSVRQSFLIQDLIEKRSQEAPERVKNDFGKNKILENLEKTDMTSDRCEDVFAPKEVDTSSDLYTNIIMNYTSPSCEGKYKCTKCFKTFHKKNLLKKHKENCRPRLQKDLLTRCKTCSRIFKDRQSLTKHLTNYHSKYTCEICSLDVQSKCEIIAHIRFSHPSSELVCHCGQILRSKNDLLKHKLEHVDSYVCQFCGDLLNTKIKLKMHVLSLHRKILSLSCGICLKLFETQQILRDHVRLTHFHQLKPLTSCTVCGKNYGTKWKTFDHLNKSHGKIFKACRTCLAIFENEEDLIQHIAKKHSDKKTKENGQEMEILKEDVGSPVEISNVPKTILKTNVDDFEPNLKVQNQISSFDPKISALLEKQLLKNVVKKSKKKKKLQEDYEDDSQFQNSSKRTVYENSSDPCLCEICLKVWPAKKHLWQHYIRCHKQVAATVCGICLKTNPSYASLQIHLRENHKNLLHGHGFGSNFICKICGRYHNARSKLNLHMAIHIGYNEQNYQPNNLKNHQNNSFGDLWGLNIEEVNDTFQNYSDEEKNDKKMFSTNQINYDQMIEEVEFFNSEDYDEKNLNLTSKTKNIVSKHQNLGSKRQNVPFKEENMSSDSSSEEESSGIANKFEGSINLDKVKNDEKSNLKSVDENQKGSFQQNNKAYWSSGDDSDNDDKKFDVLNPRSLKKTSNSTVPNLKTVRNEDKLHKSVVRSTSTGFNGQKSDFSATFNKDIEIFSNSEFLEIESDNEIVYDRNDIIFSKTGGKNSKYDTNLEFNTVLEIDSD